MFGPLSAGGRGTLRPGDRLLLQPTVRGQPMMTQAMQAAQAPGATRGRARRRFICSGCFQARRWCEVMPCRDARRTRASVARRFFAVTNPACTDRATAEAVDLPPERP